LLLLFLFFIAIYSCRFYVCLGKNGQYHTAVAAPSGPAISAWPLRHSDYIFCSPSVTHCSTAELDVCLSV